MHYSVLLVDNNPESLQTSIRELKQRELNVRGCLSFDKACDLLKEDGTIHIVLSEWELPYTENASETIQGLDIFRNFMALRHEVSLFLYTHITDSKNLTSGGIINGYFFKGENVYDDMVRKIHAEVEDKKRAPVYETLVKYANKAKDSWHTPGHASGNSAKNSLYIRDFYDFFGENLFASDVSVSVPELDSLLHPNGVIQEAQELAARAFNARYTFFSTNGTSTANKILIQTLLNPGDTILLDRNCHKSVHYGVIIAGAEPLYLMPSVNNKYGIFGPIPKERIIKNMDYALDKGKKLKAIILTNCTYDGLIYDIEDLVHEAHKRRIKVIVDEAWYGYANFHREFYPSAMAAGADYATQSTHKTMSAFSQASMIHVNDPDFEDIQDFFMENFNMHTSTSPQYPMLASLDVARKQMVMEGYALMKNVLELSDLLRDSINSLKKFRVLNLKDMISEENKNDNIRLDRTKITIDVSKSGYSSKEIEHILLSKHNIQIEKTTFNTITILLTIGATYSRINRLYLALENIEKRTGNRQANGAEQILKKFKLSVSPIRYRPRHSFYAETEELPLEDTEGRIAARMVTPYPPGIPLLVPGQIVTREILNTLSMYRNYGIEIHGLHRGLIKVISRQEEKRLDEGGFKIEE
jgi:arginine/lysine/ornithine decarboxylase